MVIDINQLFITRSGKNIIQIPKLCLEKQGAIALIGPNGSGKSTLLKSIAGIDPDFSGEILLNDQAINRYSGAERARLIGFIPQSFTPHWNQTVDELISLATTKTLHPKQAKLEAFAQFELTSLCDHHWSTLSGGEKARVLSGMALVGNPLVLFADEPGAALDIKHRLQMIQNFTQRGENQLVIVCLHELEMVFRFFKRVILLNHGEVVFYGNACDLLHQKLLDETFGVNFERIQTQEGYILNAINSRAI